MSSICNVSPLPPEYSEHEFDSEDELYRLSGRFLFCDVLFFGI